MFRTARVEEPQGLKVATLEEARWAVPFTYEVGAHRNRSIEERCLIVRYKPRPDDPVAGTSLDPFHYMRALSASLDAEHQGTREGSGGGRAPGAGGATHGSSPSRPAAAAAIEGEGSSTGGRPPTQTEVAASSSGPRPSGAGPGARGEGRRGAGEVQAAGAPEQGGPPVRVECRAPSDSYLEVVYPFTTNRVLQEQYRRFTSTSMRFGLLLEDLDTLAGDVAVRHAGVLDRVVLTASIDRISWLQDPALGELSMEHDLRLAGQVIWAGKSSMEVQIELSRREHGAPGSQDWSFIGSATFVMVARTPDRTGGAPVLPLRPQTQRERELFELGKAHMELRQRRREAHWTIKPPSHEEVVLMHDLIRNHHLHRTSAHHHHHQAVAAPMARTSLQSSSLMHSQDRNAWNVIFGGHLLRLAFEHAFATAAMHAGEYCDPVSMDDVAFLLPVPIGAIIRLTGQVVYTEGPVVRVHVRASKVEPGAPELGVTTNVFSFAFVCKSGPVRRVVPETMVEAMEYLMGYRQHARDESSRAITEAARSRL